MSQEEQEHRLSDTWSFWGERQEGSWSPDNIKPLENTTFNTVEDFWPIFSYIEKQLKDTEYFKAQTSVHMFRKNIAPTFEEPANANGGTFTCALSDRSQGIKAFTELVLALIGEAFEDDLAEDDSINGITIMSRPKSDSSERVMIKVWNKSSNSHEQVEESIFSKLDNLDIDVKYYRPFQK